MPPVCSSRDPESFCKSVDVEFKLLFIIFLSMKLSIKKVKRILFSHYCLCSFLVQQHISATEFILYYKIPLQQRMTSTIM